MPPEDEKAKLVRQWLARVELDLLAAENGARVSRLADDVLFHSQQAAEKALKAFLTWYDRPFRRTHDLEELVQQCADVEPGFREPAA